MDEDNPSINISYTIPIYLLFMMFNAINCKHPYGYNNTCSFYLWFKAVIDKVLIKCFLIGRNNIIFLVLPFIAFIIFVGSF